jgi:hypothetical protein
MHGGFRKEEIDHTEKFQAFQRFAREVGIRQRNQRLEANTEQAFDFAAMNGVHDLDCGIAWPGQLVR